MIARMRASRVSTAIMILGPRPRSVNRGHQALIAAASDSSSTTVPGDTTARPRPRPRIWIRPGNPRITILDPRSSAPPAPSAKRDVRYRERSREAPAASLAAEPISLAAERPGLRARRLIPAAHALGLPARDLSRRAHKPGLPAPPLSRRAASRSARAEPSIRHLPVRNGLLRADATNRGSLSVPSIRRTPKHAIIHNAIGARSAITRHPQRRFPTGRPLRTGRKQTLSRREAPCPRGRIVAVCLDGDPPRVRRRRAPRESRAPKSRSCHGTSWEIGAPRPPSTMRAKRGWSGV